MGAELQVFDPTAERRRVVAAVPRGCPACAPLPPAATSRYCARHLAQLRSAWLAGRPTSIAVAAACCDSTQPHGRVLAA